MIVEAVVIYVHFVNIVDYRAKIFAASFQGDGNLRRHPDLSFTGWLVYRLKAIVAGGVSFDDAFFSHFHQARLSPTLILPKAILATGSTTNLSRGKERALPRF